MACDSHVTGGFTTSSRKIRKKNGCIVGYAGDWIAGEYFADFYLGKKDKPPVRDIDDDLELLVLKSTGIYLVDSWLREVRICGKYYAVGSGSQGAMATMNMGATATEAVREATKVDDYTGGKIRSLSLE